MRKNTGLWVMVLAAVWLSSCSAGGSSSGELAGSWELVSMPGHSRIPVMVTLNFEPAEGRISGNAGCNSYSGDYKVQGGKLVIGPDMMMTLMACPDNGWNENDFLSVLPTASGFSVDGGQLVLDVDGGQMVFFR
jgi:heat shock protein HslJ